MRLSLLPILLCLLTCTSFSQERKYERINGKIKLESGTYCLYKEVPIENMNHGSRKKEFTDIVFYTVDSLPVIYMEARALSLFDFNNENRPNKSTIEFYRMIYNSPLRDLYDSRKLINYYKIEFSPLQREVNVLFHLETLHYFIKDLIWYRVFENGMFNEERAEKLIKKWESKDIDHVPDDMLTNGVTMGYLQSDLWKKKIIILRDRYKIDCEEKKIYQDDSLIATYTLNDLPETYTSGLVTSYVTHYYIVNKEGKILSDSYSTSNVSFGTTAYYVGNKQQYITYPLVDKCAQKQVATALDILLQVGKL